MLQVSRQNAPECLPLVMEPMSQLYSSPLLVLDFQSLYPSIIIAYNLWYVRKLTYWEVMLTSLSYSTCLGKLSNHSTKTLGISTVSVPPGLLAALDTDGITGIQYSSISFSLDSQISTLVTPNEVMFTKPSIREGVLPRLLSEILETRVMVKKAMKK